MYLLFKSPVTVHASGDPETSKRPLDSRPSTLSTYQFINTANSRLTLAIWPSWGGPVVAL